MNEPLSGGMAAAIGKATGAVGVIVLSFGPGRGGVGGRSVLEASSSEDPDVAAALMDLASEIVGDIAHEFFATEDLVAALRARKKA
jgi:hypothetical protein